jgi:ferredoxin
MSLLTEEQRKELQEAGIKAPYVNETCIGCSACVAICPDVFDLDDEMKAFAKENTGEFYNEISSSIEDSVSACPVNAISYE